MSDSAALSDAWVARYLQILGVDQEAPGLHALARLTRAHLLAIPFGNVTALLRYGAHHGGALPLPDLDELLALWEAGRGTGACFEIVAAFSRLLTALGYSVVCIPGKTSGFLGGHQALLVTLGGDRFLVDVATGAPFFAPIPVDRMVTVRHAGLAYRFHPGATPDSLVQERWGDDGWTPFCTYALQEMTETDRVAAFHRLHQPAAGSVISLLRLVRCTPTAVFSLRDQELSQFTPQGKRKDQLTSPSAYEWAMTGVFNLPDLPILAALAVVEPLVRAPGANVATDTR